MGTGLNRKESQPFAACLKGAKEPLMKSQRETILRDSPPRSEKAGGVTLGACPSEIHSAFIGVARLVSNCARPTRAF